MSSNISNKFFEISSKIHEAMVQYEFAEKKSNNLGRVESNLLSFLSENRKPYHMTDIAKVMGVSTSRVTHLVDSLLLKGYLVRFSTPNDRRKYLTEITQSGIEVVTEYEQKTMMRYHDLLMALPDKERESIIQAINEWRVFLLEQKKEISSINRAIDEDYSINKEED